MPEENRHPQQIRIRIDDSDRVFSLLSTYTQDESFSYLNGVQGQFVDRTDEYELRKEREALLEEKLRMVAAAHSRIKHRRQ